MTWQEFWTYFLYADVFALFFVMGYFVRGIIG